MLLPRAAVELTARADAQVVELHVALGDTVARGQIIARLDSPALRHELASACARLRAAQAQVAQAAIAVERRAALRARRSAAANVWSTEEVEGAELDWRASVAAHAMAVATSVADSVDCARLTEDYGALTVRAPFAGRVTAIAVEVHQHISAGAHVARVIDDRLFRVRFVTPASALADWPFGKAVVVVTAAGRELGHGRVERAAGEVDQASGLVVMEASCQITAGVAGLAVGGMPVHLLPE